MLFVFASFYCILIFVYLYIYLFVFCVHLQQIFYSFQQEYEVCLDCKNVEQAIGDQFICDKTIFGVVEEASLA